MSFWQWRLNRLKTVFQTHYFFPVSPHTPTFPLSCHQFPYKNFPNTIPLVTFNSSLTPYPNWSLNLTVATSEMSLKCATLSKQALIQTFLISCGNYYNSYFSLAFLIVSSHYTLCLALSATIFPKHSDGHISLQFIIPDVEKPITGRMMQQRWQGAEKEILHCLSPPILCCCCC